MSYQNNVDPSKVQIVPKDYFIFNVPIYKMFNERSAVFVMSIRPFSGDLGISIAPSTLKGNSGKQSVVEKGTKIYDYTKEITSNIIYSECIKLKEYMENMVINRKEKFVQNAALSVILGQLDALRSSDSSSYINMLNDELSKYVLPTQQEDQKNGVMIYRNTETEKKTWSFNIVSGNDGNAVMYISASKNNDKNTRVYITLGEKTIVPLYHALSSYINNYSIIQYQVETFKYLLNEINKLEVMSMPETISRMYGQNFEAFAADENTLNKLNNLRESINYTLHNCIFSWKPISHIMDK